MIAYSEFDCHTTGPPRKTAHPISNRSAPSKPTAKKMSTQTPPELKLQRKVVHWQDAKNRPRIHVFVHVASGFDLTQVDRLGIDNESLDLEFTYKWEKTILNKNSKGKQIFGHKSFKKGHYTEGRGASKAIRQSIYCLASTPDTSVVSPVKIPLLTNGKKYMCTPEEASGHESIRVIAIKCREGKRKDIKVILMIDLVDIEVYERVALEDMGEAIEGATASAGGVDY